jgi:hypothetical protein
MRLLGHAATVGSILEDIGRRLSEPVAVPYIGECRSGVGMSGKVLQVDDVAAALAGDRERRHPERMHGDVRVELEAADVSLDQLLNGAASPRPLGGDSFWHCL